MSSNKRRAVFAPQRDLDNYAATKTQISCTGSATDQQADVLYYSGWTFTSLHTNIIDSLESNQLMDSIYTRLNLEKPGESGAKCERSDATNTSLNSVSLRIPPMIFCNDVMKIEKVDRAQVPQSVFDSSTFHLSLDAEDALTLWAAQHTAENLSVHKLDVIQVPYAAIWAKMNGPSSEGDSQTPSHLRKENHDSSTSVIGGAHVDRRSPIWDWTFSSDYCCTLGTGPKARQHIVGVKGLYSPLTRYSNDPLISSIKSSPMSGIEYELLRANDVPILFYDETVLYQDDLEDCGEIVFEAKLRVMPHCWFLLSRMFLRVDGVLVRIRDNRFFHRFGTNTVHLEVTWKECKLAMKIDKEGCDDDSKQQSSKQGDTFLHIDSSSMRDINRLAQMVPVIATFNYSMSC